MKRSIFLIICLNLILLLNAGPVPAINGRDVIRLKKAGISDQTLQLLVREKTIETRAFSVQELIDMKKAGVDDKTIQVLVKENSFMKNRKPVVYGKDIRPVHLTSVPDIIELKNEGISNRIIRAIIIAVNSHDPKERENAWKLLKDLEIHIEIPESP